MMDDGIEGRVQAMVDRTRDQIDGGTRPSGTNARTSAFEPVAQDRSTVALSGKTSSHEHVVEPAGRRVLLRTAMVALLVACAGGAFVAVNRDPSPPLAPSSPESTQLAAPPREPDRYDEEIAVIDGPILFPATLPPTLEAVWFTSTNHSQDLMVEHGDEAVRVCVPAACARPTGRKLREITVDGTTFGVWQVTTEKIEPDVLPDLSAELAQYWATVEFVTERPAWLTADMQPGVIAPSDRGH